MASTKDLCWAWCRQRFQARPMAGLQRTWKEQCLWSLSRAGTAKPCRPSSGFGLAFKVIGTHGRVCFRALPWALGWLRQVTWCLEASFLFVKQQSRTKWLLLFSRLLLPDFMILDLGREHSRSETQVSQSRESQGGQDLPETWVMFHIPQLSRRTVFSTSVNNEIKNQFG